MTITYMVKNSTGQQRKHIILRAHVISARLYSRDRWEVEIPADAAAEVTGYMDAERGIEYVIKGGR